MMAVRPEGLWNERGGVITGLARKRHLRQQSTAPIGLDELLLFNQSFALFIFRSSI